MDTQTSYKDAFMTSLQRLKKKESSIDITLQLPDETTIPCHKLVLIAASPFFETMFQSGMKESSEQEVQLDFSDAVTIKMIVDYFYSGEIDINADNVQDLVAASEFLCLADLKEHLGAFMTEQIDATNCIEFYRYARKFSLGKLIPPCLEHILSNFSQAFGSSTSFTELSEEELIHVVSDDRLTAENENIVFHSVVRWVNADREQRKEAFARIAPFIRFPFCTLQECLNNIVCEDLMINPSCTELLREAISIKSSQIIFHSMHSARHVPRQAYDTKKPHLMRVYAKTNTHAAVQFTEDSSLANANWTPALTQAITSAQPGNIIILSSNQIHWIHGSQLYNWTIETKTYFQTPCVALQRTEYHLIFIQDKLFAMGGKDTNGQHCTTVESFDKKQNIWKPEPSMLQPVSKPYIIHFGTKVYVLGGFDATGPSVVTQEFDSDWGTWKMKKVMPGVCQSGAAVSLNDNIFVVGGTERACFRYTPATDSWTVLSQPTHVHNVSMAAIAWKGNILLFGDQGEEYNPDTDNWSPCQALIPTDGYLPNYPKSLFTIFI